MLQIIVFYTFMLDKQHANCLRIFEKNYSFKMLKKQFLFLNNRFRNKYIYTHKQEEF